MTQDKIKEILDDLNNLQENLLSLPDDMLLSLDSRDNESLEKGTRFIMAFNENLDRFTEVSSKIATQIKSHFSINPEEDEIEQESDNLQKRDRIVKELDRTAPHTLEENFTYKRPYGFVLEDAAYKGLKTWKNLYLNVLNILREKDPEKFDQLPEEERFISKRGKSLFSKNDKDLRIGERLESGIFVEVNFSANTIRNNIKELLEHFQINMKSMKIYLREDRDAS